MSRVPVDGRSRRRWLGRRKPGPVAFVLSGGGNLGALQIGMLRALTERGIRPDLIVGCSVGAINGAAFAEEPTVAGVARMERLWRELDGKDLMPSKLLPNAVALARRGEAIHDSEPLRRALEDQLRARTFEELAVPFQCVATDVIGVREVWFASGPLIEPILASAASSRLNRWCRAIQYDWTATSSGRRGSGRGREKAPTCRTYTVRAPSSTARPIGTSSTMAPSR